MVVFLFMARAVHLARQAQGLSSPNPAVGAVIVRDGIVVGEGHTQPPGEAHAEVMALRQAGEAARGATLYVTLEPCPHQGRTPPCAEAIVQAGIAQVHMAALDPAPWVNGGGRSRLEAAGVVTTLLEESEETWEANVAYFKHLRTGLPFITMKYAMTLDGKIATRTGESRWISGEASRGRAHEARAHADAVLVGIGTVLQDDPQLTARDGQGRPGPRQPLRVVVDSRGRTPPTAQLLRQPGRTLVAVASEEVRRRLKEVEAAGGEVVALGGPDGRVDLAALLHHLGGRGVVHLLAEGGGTLLGSLADLGLVDGVMAFVAPVLVGGQGAPGPVLGLGVERMAEAPRLWGTRVERLGDDLLVTGYLCDGPPSSRDAREGAQDGTAESR